MKQKQYQIVYVEMKDGRVGTFCGQSIVENEEDVKSVKISRPRDLPEGITWEELGQAK